MSAPDEFLLAWLDPTLDPTTDAQLSLSRFASSQLAGSSAVQECDFDDAGVRSAIQRWREHPDALAEQRSQADFEFLERELEAAAAHRALLPADLDDDVEEGRGANDMLIAALLAEEELHRALGIQNDPRGFLEQQREQLRQFRQPAARRLARLSEGLDRVRQASQAVQEARQAGEKGVRAQTGGKSDVFQWGAHYDQKQPSPKMVPALKGHQIICLSAGSRYSAAVALNGATFMWGSNTMVLPGPQQIPRRVPSLESIRIVAVSCGQNHCLFLSDSGHVLAAGNNEFGQLGVGRDAVSLASCDALPVLALEREHAVRIAAGDTHSACVTSEGLAFVWGDNACEQLGRAGPFESRPHAWIPEMRFLQVACGGSFTVGLTLEGSIVQCGRLHPDAGKPTWRLFLQPQVEGLPSSTPIVQISAGQDHALALTFRGQVYAWGSNSHCQLAAPFHKGHSPTKAELVQQVSTARLVPLSQRIVQISAGRHHSLVLSSVGSVFSWGRNFEGQLAYEQIEALSTPYFVGSLADHNIRLIAAGYSHSVVQASVVRPLCNDLSTLLASGFGSDITVNVRNHAVRLHRCILASRSPYFQQVFLQYPKLATLNISTVSYEAFFCVLEFLYSGTLHVPEALLDQVYVVARNFLIVKLEEICGIFQIDRDMQDYSSCPTIESPSSPSPSAFGSSASSSNAPSSPSDLASGFGVFDDLSLSSVDPSQVVLKRTFVFGGDRELSRDIQLAVLKIYRSGIYTDVTFVFPCGTRFQGHKAIVYCRLEYFRQLLSGLWSASGSEISITSVPADIFKLILDYAYGMPIALSSDTVVELLLAACHFQIPLLQHQCENFVSEGIDLDNVIDLLLLFELSAPTLFLRALSFATQNANQVIESSRFLELPPGLAQQIADATVAPAQLIPVRNQTVSASRLLHELVDPFTADRDDSSDDHFSEDEDLAQYYIPRSR